MPGISAVKTMIPFSKKGISWQAYWTTQPEVLFFGLYSEITGGQMPNKVDGATDFLTVAGSAGSETYQAPNTAPYIAADTDHIWFQSDNTQRTVLTAELINFDLQRTPVKYNDAAPNAIVAIMILNQAVIGVQRNRMFEHFWLPILWDNNLNAYGHVKSNRIIQNLFPGTPLLLTLTLISGGVRLDWTDNSCGLGETEIWGQSDGAAFALIDTVAAGTNTFDDTVAPVDLRYYRIRNKQDGFFSAYSDTESIALLGPELIVNGGFDDQSWWVKEVPWTIVGGVADCAGGTAKSITKAGILTAGKTYLERFTLVSITANGGYLVASGARWPLFELTTGIKTKIYVATDGTIGYTGNDNFIGSIDNASIKEILYP